MHNVYVEYIPNWNQPLPGIGRELIGRNRYAQINGYQENQVLSISRRRAGFAILK